MLSIYKARQILESKQEVNLKYWDKEGNIITANQVICTSSYHENNTFNLLHTQSGEVRKIRAWNIFELNGEEVCL